MDQQTLTSSSCSDQPCNEIICNNWILIKKSQLFFLTSDRPNTCTWWRRRACRRWSSMTWDSLSSIRHTASCSPPRSRCRWVCRDGPQTSSKSRRWWSPSGRCHKRRVYIKCFLEPSRAYQFSLPGDVLLARELTGSAAVDVVPGVLGDSLDDSRLEQVVALLHELEGPRHWTSHRDRILLCRSLKWSLHIDDVIKSPSYLS